MSESRESWLMDAIEKHCVPHFKKWGNYDLPKVRVSVGQPFGRGGKKAIGEHWHPDASEDRVGQIFISPRINDTSEVLATLVHELVHAAIGNEHGHNRVFRKCAMAVGLEGPMRATSLDDMIVQGVKGELYPVERSIFDATYEPA